MVFLQRWKFNISSDQGLGKIANSAGLAISLLGFFRAIMAVAKVGSTSGNALVFLGFRDVPFHTLIQQSRIKAKPFLFYITNRKTASSAEFL